MCQPRPESHDLTVLLGKVSDGDREAVGTLFECVYDDLKELAGAYLRRERHDHTLQSTALVHESYARLIDRDRAKLQDRAHFFAVAAQAMRRILVEHARKRHALKRGGRRARVSLEQLPEQAEERDELLLALDQGLDALARQSQRQAHVVELRFFAGMTIPEAAEALSVSHATVERDWAFAKAWLHRALSHPTSDEE